MHTAESPNKSGIEYGIYRDGQCWMVATLGPESESLRVFELFGTLALPMPLLSSVDEREVRARLQESSPGCTIHRMMDAQAQAAWQRWALR
jgi:hypothetical protein